MLKRLKKILDLENQTALDLPNNSCYIRKEQYSHTHTHTLYILIRLITLNIHLKPMSTVK